MLRYFIERSDLKQVNYICKQLNEVKNRLYLNDFDNPQKELELCNVSFEEIFTIADSRYDRSRWGVVNGITEIAQNYTLEKRLAIEQLAGEILTK